MISRITYHYFIKTVYILIDIFCLVFSIYAAALLRPRTLPFPISIETLFFDAVNPFQYILYFWILVTIILNNSNRLYQTRRDIIEPIEIWYVVKSICTATLIVIVAIYLMKIEGFPRTVMGFSTIFMVMTLSLWRICKRILVNYMVAHGYNNHNALIVGAGKVGASLAEQIRKRPELGLKILGYLDDFKEGTTDLGYPIIGKLEDFENIARKEFIDEIFIAGHMGGQKFVRIIEEAKAQGIAIRVIPQGFDLMSGQFHKFNIGFIPILEYSDKKILRNQAGKRIFDLFLSLIGFIFLAPVLLILSLWVLYDSPGPVLYVSKRYGRKGRIFNMFKFRSMVANADYKIKDLKGHNEVDGPIFKIKSDPRVTKFGKFLRKFSLDELPQIVNVILGDMSLVGPRPLPIEQIEKEDLRQLQRLEVRPGITGLWQIRGRSDISFKRLIKWDVWYINNWSLWLDITILYKTMPVVVKGKGAY